MIYRRLLALLLPPVSYDRNGPRLQAELECEANVLDTVAAYAKTAVDSITPFFSTDLLPDWERVCAITPPAGTNYQQRLDAVLAKLRETGGLSIPYFTELAKRLGYDIQISEFVPFYLDYSQLDVDPLYEEDVVWVWHVQVKGGSTRSFPFHLDYSCVDEALLSFGDPVIEAVIDDLKPGYTFAIFDYEDLQP